MGADMPCPWSIPSVTVAAQSPAVAEVVGALSKPPASARNEVGASCKGIDGAGAAAIAKALAASRTVTKVSPRTDHAPI